MKCLAVAGLLFVSSAFGASALFPTPLHIVRKIDDPLAKAPIIIDEYCYGNRIVTINGPRVAISDFAELTLTEIDHGSLTYGVTRFDQIAAAQLPKASAQSKATHRQVAVDRSVGLSRELTQVGCAIGSLPRVIARTVVGAFSDVFLLGRLAACRLSPLLNRSDFSGEHRWHRQ